MNATTTLNDETKTVPQTKHTGFALAKMLLEYGVEYIFGIPGGQTLPLYDASYNRREQLKHLLFRDERSAGHAACAYSRISGKLGVCDATVGPGATNLPSALGEALNSSTPMIAIVGEHPVPWINKVEYGRASQGIDQVGMLKHVTKKVVYVPTQECLPELVRTAFLEATSGRPGPVALVIPADVFRQEGAPANLDVYVDPSLNRFPSRRSAPDPQDVERAARLLHEAKRPVMLVGGGVQISGATQPARELAERLSMPIVYTITGKGSIPDNHPLNMGVVGIFANAPSAEAALREADLVFLVGNKSSQSSSFAWTLPRVDQKVVHLDVDPAEVGRIFRTDAGLVGDAKLGLEGLLNALPDTPGANLDENWLAQLRDRKEAWEERKSNLFAIDEKPIQPYRVMGALNAVMGPEDILVSDAGFASGWGALYFSQRSTGRHSLFPRGLAGLGFAAAAGIGAQLGAPDRRVVTLSGDGGFTYVMPELATQAHLGLPIINVVLNNAAYGWVKWAEQAWYKGSFSASELQPIDFAKVAEGLGCVGMHVEDPDQIENALTEALELNRPVVLDIHTDAVSTPNVKS
jgi:acetolactate synthase-1/2/3 large subunit